MGANGRELFLCQAVRVSVASSGGVPFGRTGPSRDFWRRMICNYNRKSLPTTVAKFGKYLDHITITFWSYLIRVGVAAFPYQYIAVLALEVRFILGWIDPRRQFCP